MKLNYKIMVIDFCMSFILVAFIVVMFFILFS